ncbi:MAG: M20/M25/M40 family metallo-hydrolase [Deltaproteobacteria bacterium]|nr:M20/M25/M40 family metallo-hydrolase [Deltaproteobacteria bacterium]
MNEAVKDKVLARIKDDEVIGLLRELHARRSFSGQEQECAEFLVEFMGQAGLEARLQEVEPGRSNAIGLLRGSGGGQSLMFNGHLDIDPVPEHYGRDPWAFSREEGRIYGHGVQNMKAGDTAMVMAAVAVAQAGMRLRGDLVVAGVVGELQGGVGTDHLLRSGLVTDTAIVPEPTWLNIRTVHAGWLQLLVTTKGRTGWIGSMHLYKTVNAIDKMTKVVEALERIQFRCKPRPDLPGLPRLLVGGMIAGMGADYALWRPSFVPDRATVAVDVRLVPGQTVETAVEDIREALEAVRQEDPELEFEIELPPATYREPWRAVKLAIPPLDLPKTDPLVGQLLENHRRILGRDPEHIGPVLPNSYAGADTGHLFAAGVRALNYGPSGAEFRPQWCEEANLLNCTRVLALTAVDVCSTEKRA